jgi:hypothetical protein
MGGYSSHILGGASQPVRAGATSVEHGGQDSVDSAEIILDKSIFLCGNTVVAARGVTGTLHRPHKTLRKGRLQRRRDMTTLTMIAFGVVLGIGIYGLTAVMLRKQQPQERMLK